MKNIITIDCHYTGEKIACAYLVKNGENSYFVENNTAPSVSYLLAAMQENNISPDQIQYIIITHVHLDHAGGTAELLKHCPNAIVLAHPKAARHLINPSKLVESAKAVYGDEVFRNLYGEIEPVPETRIIIPDDMSQLQVGNSTLQFNYTKGHANHHFVIYDMKEETVFTGDSFGIAYPSLQHGRYPFIFPSSSPTDFDATEARLSIEKIATCGARFIALTHFGIIDYIGAARSFLLEAIESYEKIQRELIEHLKNGEPIQELAVKKVTQWFSYACENHSLDFNAVEPMLRLDIDLNSQGLAFAAQKALKTGGHI